MTDLSWFSIFALISVAMIVVSAWMAWFSRRAMKVHKNQMEDMVREMRGVIDEEEVESPPPDKAA